MRAGGAKRYSKAIRLDRMAKIERVNAKGTRNLLIKRSNRRKRK